MISVAIEVVEIVSSVGESQTCCNWLIAEVVGYHWIFDVMT